MRSAIVNANNDLAILSAKKAYELGLIKPVLIGNSSIIKDLLIDNNCHEFQKLIVESDSEVKSAQIASNMGKNDEIKKFRDRSIILIGFSGGFRRNEIVSLDYEDLDFVQEGLKISLKRSKTDQFGEGSAKGLPYFDNSQYCPVVSIRKWIEISKINSGPLFRRFIKGSKLSDNRSVSYTHLTLPTNREV